MAWGAPRGVDDLVDRVGRSDPSLTSLCVLRLRRVDEAGCRQLAAALAANTTLRELSLASHSVPPGAAAAFAEALAANSTLQSLDLGDRSFGDEGLAALAPGVSASLSLRCLNLEAKGLTGTGLSALAAALAGSGSDGGRLEELHLGQNSLGGGSGEALSALLAALPSLRSLDLSSCDLQGADGVRQLAAALQGDGLQQLDSLQMDGNELGAEGAAALAPALGGSALRQLSLQRCALDGEGVATLAAALPASITALDLSGNPLGSGGAAALAAALAAGGAPQLHKLVLAGCGLGDADIAVLAAALATQASAGGGMTLDLSGNAAGGTAVAALAAAPLASLCLHDCQLGAGGAEAAAALAGHLAPGSFQRLAELDLSGNHLEAAQLAALLQALQVSAPASGGGGGDGGGVGAPQGACPSLRLLVVASNPGAASEEVQGAIERVQEARPGLDVVRRAADTGEGGLMGR